MSWNHRVIKFKDGRGEDYFSVCEVYYNSDGSIYAHSAEPRAPYGDTLDDLEEILTWMLQSIREPVLVDGEIEFKDNEMAATEDS